MRHIKKRGEFRVESNRTMRRPHWWPASVGNELLVHDRSLAVVLAAKTNTVPCGGVRVVHAPTGEVIFRKLNECACGH